MLSIERSASPEIRSLLVSACSARVLTACSTADFAESDLGRNSLSSSAPNSSGANSVAASAPAWASVSAIPSLLLLGGLAAVVGLRRRSQRLKQRRILHDLRYEVLSASFAVHVRHQVRKLGARLEKLA